VAPNFSIGSILKEIKKREKNAPLRPPVKGESDPKRLGPYKFKEPSMEVALTEELSESLRTIKVGTKKTDRVTDELEANSTDCPLSARRKPFQRPLHRPTKEKHHRTPRPRRQIAQVQAKVL
jgi:hypothetical protein